MFMANIIFLFGQPCSSCNYSLQEIPWTKEHVTWHQKNGNSKTQAFGITVIHISNPF